MQAFDQRIVDIVEKGLEGNGLTREETRTLFEVPERTREAALIRWAGQELSLRAADGIAEIHGQIGLNSTKCPMDCGFCSFAKSAGQLSRKSSLTASTVFVNEPADTPDVLSSVTVPVIFGANPGFIATFAKADSSSRISLTARYMSMFFVMSSAGFFSPEYAATISSDSFEKVRTEMSGNELVLPISAQAR